MLAISAILDAANAANKALKVAGKPMLKSRDVLAVTDFAINTESLVANHIWRYQRESTFCNSLNRLNSTGSCSPTGSCRNSTVSCSPTCFYRNPADATCSPNPAKPCHPADPTTSWSSTDPCQNTVNSNDYCVPTCRPELTWFCDLNTGCSEAHSTCRAPCRHLGTR